MNAPLVSILVPVYNGKRFLAECLDSILAQDFEDYELLLSDDGSTDGSAGLIEEYARRDARIRWWRSPKNLGIGGNFNACLHEARGRFIKYVLQDDKLLTPSVLRRMVEALQADSSVSLVVSAALLIDERSQPVRERQCYQQSCVREGREVILYCLERNANKIGEPSLALFRKEQAGVGYDERLKQLLDLDLWFHLLEQGRFHYIAEPLCAFRRHAAQQTEVNRRSGASAREQVVLVEKHFSKPWLRALAAKDRSTRWLLCRQLYYLWKDNGRENVVLPPEFEALGSSVLYSKWLLWHRLSTPFGRLSRWFRKKEANRHDGGESRPV